MNSEVNRTRPTFVKNAKAVGWIITVDVGGVPYYWTGSGLSDQTIDAKRFTAEIAAKSQGRRVQAMYAENKVKVQAN